MHKRVCKNKGFWNFITSSKDTNVLESNLYQKSDIATFTIYADPRCLLENIDECQNNPVNSSTTKISEHIPDFQCLQYLHLEA